MNTGSWGTRNLVYGQKILWYFFFFVREPGLEDEPDWPRRSLVPPTLLFSSPIWGALMSRTVGWDRMMAGWDGTRVSGQDDVIC